MGRTTRVLLWLVAALHVAFFVAELFLWETLTPIARLYDPREAAKEAPQLAALTVALGRNTGLYNGVLAGVFVWSLTSRSLTPQAARSLAIYLLFCVIVAGVFGGAMIKPTIPLFQSLPAVVALVQVWRSPARQTFAG